MEEIHINETQLSERLRSTAKAPTLI